MSIGGNAITKRNRVIVSCVLLSIALPVSISGENGVAGKLASSADNKVSSELQIQSAVLRIEFDHNLHSRVIALFGSKPKLLVPLSASETITTTVKTTTVETTIVKTTIVKTTTRTLNDF